jgi:uncharacterized protein (DUF433 family)
MSVDPISSGVYTIDQAATLINASPRVLRGWLVGHHEKKAGPIITREIESVDNRIVLSFVNLIEARFIDEFSKRGINVRSIRAMVKEARRVLNHPHPFASNVIFGADARTIFLIGQQTSPTLYDLRGKNVAMYDILKREIKQEMVYGPSGLAEAWFPRKDIAPSVVLQPSMAFGQPALKDFGVPTRTIYQAYLSEGKNFSSVARWFDLPVNKVREAVHFEQALQRTLH